MIILLNWKDMNNYRHFTFVMFNITICSIFGGLAFCVDEQK